MASIGEQIITARKAKGMTQDALSKALNVSRSAIAHWEGDRRLPDAEMLLKLSEILEYSFEGEAMKTSEGDPQAPEPTTAGETRTVTDNPLHGTRGHRMTRRMVLYGALALALVLIVTALALSGRNQKMDNGFEINEPAYPVEYFRQAAPNEPGKAFIKLSATSRIQEGTGRQYQMYTFQLSELNGIGFAIDTIEVCAYQGQASHSEIYTAADMMQYDNDPVIEPYGTFDFVGGFPAGAFDSVGVVVRGKDANQEPLSFTGYIAF